MATPLGDFIRAKRDATNPTDLGLSEDGRRRAPGLRRTELAARARISVEYLTRIEQGRDRNPTGPVINAVADALSLTTKERRHLAYLAKITGGACAAHSEPEPPPRSVRAVQQTLDLLEPGIAFLTNRIGDILAYTTGFEFVMQPAGLLADDYPNPTRFVFTDPNARAVFPDWAHVADEQAFDLWLGPSASASEWFKSVLAPLAGPEFTSRLDQHLPPDRVELEIRLPQGDRLRFNRETLEIPEPDNQQIVVLLPADHQTTQAIIKLGNARAGIQAG